MIKCLNSFSESTNLIGLVIEPTLYTIVNKCK